MLNKLLHKLKLRVTPNSTGFTLIELLIVIVIIGILAGVLIAVIDPNAQQNRARDASVQATMNKLALAIQAFNAAYGTLPDGLQITNSIANTGAVTVVSGCIATGDTCIFTYANAALPTGGTSGCNAAAADSWRGAAAGTCSWRYDRNAAGQFHLYAKSFGRSTEVFRYRSATSSIGFCPSANPTTDPASAAC